MVAVITRAMTSVQTTHDAEHGRIKQVTSTETTFYLGMTEKRVGSGDAITWHDYIEADGIRFALRVYDAAIFQTTWPYFIHDHLVP